MINFVALGSDAPDYVNNLQNRGYEVISVPRFSLLSEPVSRHCDMLFARILDTVVINEKYSCSASSLTGAFNAAGYSIVTDNSEDFSKYPEEAKYNVLYHGGKIYGNKKCVSPVIVNIAEKNSIPLIPVNQGYAACSCAVCGEGIITADPSVFRVLTKNLVSCLLISEGNIGINGYSFGFIGGASGYSPTDNTLYFCGDIKRHPDYKRIHNFADSMGVSLFSLGDGPLFDIGGLAFFRAVSNNAQ